jgi:organic hydroperoxide reductase OsmC/OhrA
MATPFPHHYATTITRGAARTSLHAGERPAIVGGAPPEFDGDDAVWSPEHLLLGAVGLCIETTFEAFAKRASVPILTWTAHVNGTLDRTATGLAFTRIVAHVDVTVEPEAVGRAEGVMERTKRSCIVSASLAVPVEVEARISAAPDVAA